jgi:hypothetical protein
MWIRRDDRGWCDDLIWGDMWMGTDDKGCSLDQWESAIWIGKDLKRIFHDKYGIIYAL